MAPRPEAVSQRSGGPRPFNPQAARQAQRKVRRLRRRLRGYQRQEKRDKQYDPLAPLTGARLRQEMTAAERLRFGGAQRELGQATADAEQTKADRATYYDDYRQALREATARVNEANRVNVETTQARIDQAHTEDSAGVAARDAAQSEQAAKFGRAPVQSAEGAQAVAAQRSQGDQSLARLRGQASADTKLMELRGSTAVLKKAEDQGRQDSRLGKLRQEGKDLERERGDFRVDFRRRSRQDEREYAAIQKEFGLKRRGQDLEFGNSRAQRKLEREKLAAQKIVARIYSSADKAGARAQIRVAKLQLQKGKISQKQYREIVNIYKGLPDRGHGFQGDGKKPGSGNKPLQTWEKDKVSNAVRILTKNSALTQDKKKWLQRMQDEGVPLRLARIAWSRYVKKAPGTNYNGPG